MVWTRLGLRTAAGKMGVYAAADTAVALSTAACIKKPLHFLVFHTVCMVWKLWFFLVFIYVSWCGYHCCLTFLMMSSMMAF